MIATTLLALALLAQDPKPSRSESRIRKLLNSGVRDLLEQKENQLLVARGAWLAAQHRLLET